MPVPVPLAWVALAGLVSTQSPAPPSCRAPRIERVEIVRQDIFDAEAGSLYRFANKTHVVTREGVVRSELLFTEGDVFDAEAIEQSERNLRTRAYLSEIDIVVLSPEGEVLGRAGQDDLAALACAPGVPGAVQVRVTTHDSWSTSIEATAKKAGDRFLWGIGMSETNFLGFGKEVVVSHFVDIDRTTDEVSYRDPRVGGGKMELEVVLADRSDGGRGAVTIGTPFRSLDDTWAWRLRSEAFDQLDPRYFRGDRAEDLRHVRRRQDIEVARRIHRSGDAAVRAHVAFRAWDDTVRDEIRDWGIFELALSRTENRFLELSHVSHERPQDINLGGVSRLSFGFAPAGFIGRSRVTLLSASHAQGLAVGRSGLVLGSIAWSGRFEDGDLRNGLAEARLTYLGVPGPRRAVVATAWLRDGTRLDPEIQLTLGASNGLAGYPVHRFVGDRTLLVGLEHRWFVTDDLWRLLSLGVTTFANGGWTWQGPSGGTTEGMRSDVGVGLLLGRKSASARNAAVRIDLAYALRPVPDASRWVLSVTPVGLEFR